MRELRDTWRTLSKSIFVGERLESNLKALSLAGITVAVLSLALIALDLSTHQAGIYLAASAFSFSAGVGCAYCAGVRKNRELAAIIPTAFCAVIITIYAFTGFVEGFGILWAILLPVGMCYFVSVKYGIILSAYYTLLFAALFYLPVKERLSAYYTGVFMQRFPLLYATLLALTAIAMIQYRKSVLASIEYEEQLREQKRIADAANRAKSGFLAPICPTRSERPFTRSSAWTR